MVLALARPDRGIGVGGAFNMIDDTIVYIIVEILDIIRVSRVSRCVLSGRWCAVVDDVVALALCTVLTIHINIADHVKVNGTWDCF